MSSSYIFGCIYLCFKYANVYIIGEPMFPSVKSKLFSIIGNNLKYISLILFLQYRSTPPAAATIFFGANDAALSGRASERQHVPVEEYKENLRKIVHHLKVTHYMRSFVST